MLGCDFAYALASEHAHGRAHRSLTRLNVTTIDFDLSLLLFKVAIT